MSDDADADADGDYAVDECGHGNADNDDNDDDTGGGDDEWAHAADGLNLPAPPVVFAITS